MDNHARTVEQFVRDWWIDGHAPARLPRILNAAVTVPPTRVLPFARACSILERSRLASSLAERVSALRAKLDALCARVRAIDSLGDMNNEPEVLFAVLGDEASHVRGFDANRIRMARLAHQTSRAAAAQAFLQELDMSAFDERAKAELQLAIKDIEERERFESWGLFVGEERTEAIALGVSFVIREAGQEIIDLATTEIRQQARMVGQLLGISGWGISLEWPAAFAGESIGLPLAIAGLTAQGALPRDALLASTGRLDLSGNLLGVVGISEKVAAAEQVGMKRVLVPRDNYSEAAAAARDLSVIPVDHINDIVPALRASLTAIELDFAAMTRLVRASLRDYGLALVEEQQHVNGRCFDLASSSGKVKLWVYTNGRVVAQGGASSTLDRAQRLVRALVPPDPEPRPIQPFRLPTDELQQKARTALEQVGACHDHPHSNEIWRLRIKRGRSAANVVLYSTGSCVLQGKAPAWQTVFDVLDPILAPIGGMVAQTPAALPIAPGYDVDAPHIGTDEAGKGDYFGPLVSAAVYVDRGLMDDLKALGVRDSKTLSDKRVGQLAQAIKRIAEGRYAVTPIHPPKFNELYSQFNKEKKNLNSLLAWGHAKSIDRLLSAPAARGIGPAYVLVDQFADVRYVEERTGRAGVPIHQRPKAEDDIAVAAASILARDAFLTWLRHWSEQSGVQLAKGASPQVIEAARQFVRRWGRAALGDVAKLNFRTTKQVLEGEDEPPDLPTPPWSAHGKSEIAG